MTSSAIASEEQSEQTFGAQIYHRINETRWVLLEPLIARLKNEFHLSRALDVGAGGGYFAGKLARAGFSVTAIDGRAENIATIRARCPQVAAAVVDVQAADALTPYSDHDFVFCAGLLYHLDNPVAGIGNVASHPAPVVYIDTQLCPGDQPVFRFVEEGEQVDQGLSYRALVPSQWALVRLLDRFGRGYVYEIEAKLDDPQYQETARLHRLRRMFLALRQPLDLPGLRRVQAARAGKGFHNKRLSLLTRAFLKLTGQ